MAARRQPVAYVVGIGVVQLVEDRQCLLPCDAGGVAVAGGLMGVAEPGERVTFVVAFTEFADQRDGVLVAGDGLVVVAEVVVGVAEAVQSAGLAQRVA